MPIWFWSGEPITNVATQRKIVKELAGEVSGLSENRRVADTIISKAL